MAQWGYMLAAKPDGFSLILRTQAERNGELDVSTLG